MADGDVRKYWGFFLFRMTGLQMAVVSISSIFCKNLIVSLYWNCSWNIVQRCFFMRLTATMKIEGFLIVVCYQWYDGISGLDCTILQTCPDQVFSVLWRLQNSAKRRDQLTRVEAQGFAGHLLQRIHIISIYDNQLKISINLVISVFDRSGRNLLHREKLSIFVHYVHHKHHGTVQNGQLWVQMGSC